MNYCLSSQVGPEYWKKAQEIRIKYKELNKLLDIYEANPNLHIILTIKFDEIQNINWDEIVKYNKMWQDKIIIETDSFKIMEACDLFNLKYFYGVPVNNFYDFRALVEYGCTDVKIMPPLTHMLDRLENFEVTIRMCPNVAYYAYIPRDDGVCGGWVRPEDVDYYADYVDVFEFEDCDEKKEKALFKIYAEQGKWPGLLNDLITNLNYTAINRMVLKDFGQIRMFCRQKCQMGINCTACYRILNLADPDKIEKIKAKLNKENQNENLNI